MPYTDSGRNSTSTDHRLQTEKPTCSEKIEKKRLRRGARRAGGAPHTRSPRPPPPTPPPPAGGLPELRFLRPPVVDPPSARCRRWRCRDRGRRRGGGRRGGGRRTGGSGHATTVATRHFPAVAQRLNSCSVLLTAADPLW